MEVDNDNKNTIVMKIMTTSVRKGSDCYADDDQHRPAGKLPAGALVVLALCMTLHSYTLVNLFPYVGLMVKHLLTLETTNEAGEMCHCYSTIDNENSSR